MPVAKTIWECPVISLVSEIDGSQRLVIQPSSTAGYDNSLPLNILSQWILSNYQTGLYSGTTNPLTALGNNGDLYLQSGNVVKQKIAGVWVTKWNFSNAAVDADTIPATTAIPFFLDASLYPGASENSEIITKISFPDPTTGTPTGKPVRVYDILAVEQDTNGDGTGTFTGWNIYGHPNGSGQFNEDTFITIKL